MFRSVAVIVVLAHSANLFGGPVVLTGDSITVDYAPFVPGAMTVAQGGLDASAYMGQSGVGQPNYAQLVVDLNPETVIFLLGANDAANPGVPATRFNLYKTNVGNAFDLFELSTALRVIVLSILPVDEAAMIASFGNNTGQGMNDRVDNNYNPWLQSQVTARSKFEYLDVNAAIQTNPNWVAELLNPDGLHPSAPAGQQWLANQVISAIPEPSSFLSVALCGLAAAVCRWRTRPRWVIGAPRRWLQRVANDRFRYSRRVRAAVVLDLRATGRFGGGDQVPQRNAGRCELRVGARGARP